MKVKYADQVAFATITPTNAGNGAEYDSLEEGFPTLEAADAIFVKKVVLFLNNESVGLIASSPA
jgi:hypothetical protein